MVPTSRPSRVTRCNVLSQHHFLLKRSQNPHDDSLFELFFRSARRHAEYIRSSFRMLNFLKGFSQITRSRDRTFPGEVIPHFDQAPHTTLLFFPLHVVELPESTSKEVTHRGDEGSRGEIGPHFFSFFIKLLALHAVSFFPPQFYLPKRFINSHHTCGGTLRKEL